MISNKLIAAKHIYEDPANNDGYRVLVNRIWPWGVSKEDAKLDDWPREIAPSDDLRRWFDHDPRTNSVDLKSALKKSAKITKINSMSWLKSQPKRKWRYSTAPRMRSTSKRLF